MLIKLSTSLSPLYFRYAREKASHEWDQTWTRGLLAENWLLMNKINDQRPNMSSCRPYALWWVTSIVSLGMYAFTHNTWYLWRLYIIKKNYETFILWRSWEWSTSEKTYPMNDKHFLKLLITLNQMHFNQLFWRQSHHFQSLSDCGVCTGPKLVDCNCCTVTVSQTSTC